MFPLIPKYKFSKLPAFILLCFLSQCVFAWDSAGHRVISAIAYANLTPEAKQKTDTLTNLLDADYPPLARFLYVSTLPDQWRKQDQGLSNSWHFIDLPWSTDGTLVSPPGTPNLINILTLNEKLLINPNATDAQKASALAYVVHLTEDTHQPLHCINRFSHTLPHGDRGGNLLQIQTKYADNLHAYWDQSIRLLHRYPLSNKQIAQLARTIQINYPKSIFGSHIADVSVTHWAQESYTLAQEKVYGVTSGKKPSAAYQQMTQVTATQQIALAGYRLANLLNQLFTSDTITVMTQ